MATEAQNRANAKYRRDSVRQLTIRFYPKDRDLYDYVKGKPKISEYVLSLIRKDKEKGCE